jgi:hypothetical protein
VVELRRLCRALGLPLASVVARLKITLVGRPQDQPPGVGNRTP